MAAEVRDSWGNVGTARTYLPVDDLPAVPGEISITPLADGLSPNGDGILDSLDFKLAITNTESLQSWRFVVSHSASGPQKTYTGEASALGDTIIWNGRNDTGGLPPEGVYTAELFIDYGSTYKAVSVKSRKFVLDAVHPKLLLTIEPPSLVPDEGGLVSPAKISLDAQSAFARMSSWKLSLVDASAKVLNSYAGDWPPPALSWDGVAQDGSLAKPNSAYTVIATITDQFGLSTQTKSELAVGGLPPATEQSSVLALSKGFSPAAKGSMKLALAFGNKNLIKAWRLDIEREDRSVRMRFPGSPAMGDSFTWDGKLQDGTVAPDGRYTASLSLDYGRVYAPTTAASAAFVLASTPPQASLSLVPPLFSPDGDGEGESLTISLAAETRYAAINDWNLSIFDPAGNLFTSFKGKWPPAPIVWNGRNAKNETVESAEDYPVVARVRDEFGNTSEVKSAAHVDILLVRVGDGYRIRIASIVFKPFTADYLDVSPDLAERNLSALNLLAEKLKKFPGYQIRLIGHAVMVNWDDPAKGRAEQAKVLIPLSRSRAEAIMQALAQRGVEAGRMVADGAGAADPVVPDSDFENRWKNRRVEFFLQKKR